MKRTKRRTKEERKQIKENDFHFNCKMLIWSFDDAIKDVTSISKDGSRRKETVAMIAKLHGSLAGHWLMNELEKLKINEKR